MHPQFYYPSETPMPDHIKVEFWIIDIKNGKEIGRYDTYEEANEAILGRTPGDVLWEWYIRKVYTNRVEFFFRKV